MRNLLARARGRLGQLSRAVVQIPSHRSVDTLRNGINGTAANIAQLLNPSPLAHVMGETAEAVDGFVGRNLKKNRIVAATVTSAAEWKSRQVQQGLDKAKSLMKRKQVLDKGFLDFRDRCLARLMEIKTASIPEPIERIFC